MDDLDNGAITTATVGNDSPGQSVVLDGEALDTGDHRVLDRWWHRDGRRPWAVARHQ